METESTRCSVDAEPLRSIVANCRRLLNDANILISGGSAGSAMALAILAFEEAGKGSGFELNIPKTKKTPSWHHFRQAVSGLVLGFSFFQKYGLKLPPLSQQARKMLEERWKGEGRLSDVVHKPAPDELRTEIADLLRPDLERLDADQKFISSVELRWVSKIMLAALAGDIEALRQKGIYVDLSGEEIKSDPSTISHEQALYWICVAERTLSLLERGEFRGPYGELAALLESLPRPLPNRDELFERVGLILGENRSTNLPARDQEESPT